MTAYLSARPVFTPLLGLAILGAAVTGAGCDDRPALGEATGALLDCGDAGLVDIVAHPDLYAMKKTDRLYAGFNVMPGPDTVVYFGGILANDDLQCLWDEEQWAITLLEMPSFGLIGVQPGGQFIYNPHPGLPEETCRDRFSYYVTGDAGGAHDLSISRVVFVDILFQDPGCPVLLPGELPGEDDRP